MLKILHTSDVHLGAKLSFLGEKARDHRRQIADTFRAVAKEALTRHVDLFLVAGDLFDNPFPASSYVYLVQEVFAELLAAGVFVAVIPGNHDRLVPGSVWAGEAFAKEEQGGKLKIFRQPELETWELAELDTTVYGVATTLQKSKRSPLAGWSKIGKLKYHVGLAHGSVDIRGEAENYPIAIADINKLGLDYLALGDWHSMLAVSKQSVCWYCGAPELVNRDQQGAGNCIYAEIDDSTKVTSLAVGTRSVAKVQLDIARYLNNLELKRDILANSVSTKTGDRQRSGPQLFLQVELTGIRSLTQEIDIDSLQADLEDEFFYLRIDDNSHLELSATELGNFPDELVVGKYIRHLQAQKGADEQKNRLIDQAIQYGVSLLKGQTHDL